MLRVGSKETLRMITNENIEMVNFTHKNSHIYSCRITQWEAVLNERSCEERGDGVNERVNDDAWM